MNSIIVDTSRLILQVYSHKIVLASYPVIIGRNSHQGPKEQEGDQRTPKGSYYICTINYESSFTLFFGISYPNRIDAEKARSKGLISIDQYNEIIKAQNNKIRPPWNTPLGGEVGIHGGGICRDGTRGCIGMKDEDVLSLEKFISLGMTIDIG